MIGKVRNPVKNQVALVQRAFVHYRAALLNLLLQERSLEFVLVGDTHSGRSGIKSWNVPIDRFRRAPIRLEVGNLAYQAGLWRLALSRRINCVIYEGNPYYLSTWISAVLARIWGKRVLFWTHGWRRRETGIKGLLRRLFYCIPHALLLYGDRAKSIGLELGFAADKLYVIYNSLDYEAQKEVREALVCVDHRATRARLFSNPDLPLVICTARLIRACRFDLLIEAQALLSAEGHLVNVLLVGDGPERKALEQMAAERSLSVAFCGECHDEEVLARLYVAATVTVSPGKVGLTAIHSMTYGVPVITHDDPAHQMPEWEAINPGLTGDFFRRNDARDLANVIRRWTREITPPESVRRACYAVIEAKYNPHAHAEAIKRAVVGLRP